MSKSRFLLVGLATLLCCGMAYAAGSTSPRFLPAYKGVWSAPPTRMPSNRVPDGAICGNGDIGMAIGGTPDKQVFYFSKTDFWKALNGYPGGGVCLVGKLLLTAEGMQQASYHMEQRIADATLHGRFVAADRAAYTMETWCAASENTAVIRLKADGKPVNFNLAFEADDKADEKIEQGEQDGILWTVSKFDDAALEWPTGIAVAMQTMGRGTHFTLQPGETATIVMTFSTNHETGNYLANAVGMAKKAKEKSLSKLFAKHCQWWQEFWSESQVSLSDPMLEQYYYGSHYLLACCSRNVAFPPGLWGTSITQNTIFGGWAGDYHLNYNHQAPWWGAYSSNHLSITEPYDTPLLEYMDMGRQHARDFLGKRGIYYPVGIGPKGFCSSMYPLTPEGMMKEYGISDNKLENGYMFLGQKSNAVFASANMFMRFYSTYDAAYAKKVYPYIRALADFWEDYLTYENGRYVSYNDNFWEVGPWEGKDFRKSYGDNNPTVSLGMCRMLFKGIIDMSRFLHKDEEKIEKWNHILTHLSEIPTVTEDGKVRIKACESGNGSGSRTAPGFGRVMMHGLVFPSGVFGPVNHPDFARILLEELYRWNDGHTRFQGMRDSGWENLGNGFETFFTSAARLGYDGNLLIDRLKERIRKTAKPNLWITQDGGGIETLSAVPSCVNEMLLQSYEGVIRLFPVWPTTRAAHFDRLRAYGAFLVSASCRDGRVASATIVSERGRVCKIENPWKDDGCVVIRGNGKRETYHDSVLTLSTNPHETLRLEPVR